MTNDGTDRVATDRGAIRCSEFPVVVLTSNSERDFPPAFLRRCIRLDIAPPDRDKLKEILVAHFGDQLAADPALISRFVQAATDGQHIATDQLLNALQLENSTRSDDDPGWQEVIEAVLRPLSEGN